MIKSGLKRVVCIVGTTGVGKTKLSIEIAKALNGEVVNTDAMQMYQGLDIATAKASLEEQSGVPHHLLSILQPTETWDVKKFQEAALPVIEDIHQRGKLPVLVGGTMYYMQSLLWKDQLITDAEEQDDEGGDGRDSAVDYKGSTEEKVPGDLHRQLEVVDPEMATRLHPNNVRKIARSLQVYSSTGRKHSDIIKEQRKKGLEVRYLAQALWLDATKETLNQRIETRVDKMNEMGIVGEVETLWREYKLHHCLPDTASPEYISTTTGVWQSIGFKEFIPYLAYKSRKNAELTVDSSWYGYWVSKIREYVSATVYLSRPEDTAARDQKEEVEILTACLLSLKTATKRYAKKQLSWIRNKFINRNVPVLRLDTSNISQWDSVVLKPALERIGVFLTSDGPDGEALTPLELKQEEWFKYHCEVCQRTLDGRKEWEQHLVSRQHKKLRKSNKRRWEEYDVSGRSVGGEGSEGDGGEGPRQRIKSEVM